MLSGQQSKRDLRDLSAGGLDGLELPHQRMGVSDFVVAIGTHEHEVLQIGAGRVRPGRVRPGQQLPQQVERRHVEPLQVVDEQRQGMLRSGKDADKPSKHQLETPLRVLRRQLGHRGLFSNDVLEFRHQVDYEPSIRAESLQEGVAPTAQFGVALAQKRPHEALKSLSESRIRDVTLVLIELARGEQPARHQHPVQLIDDGGLADARVARDQHQLRSATSDHAVEGGEQALDLALSPIQLLGHQQPVCAIVSARREGQDASASLPFEETSPEVGFDAGSGLIAFLGGLGQQLHDDRGYCCRNFRQPLARRHRLPRDVTVNPLHGIGGGEWQAAREHFIESHAERIQITSRIDGTIHSSGLLGRHIGERPCDDLRGLRGLALAWQLRCDSEAHQPHLAGLRVHQSVAGLDVLVNETALMYPAKGGRQSDGETQE